LRNGRGGGKWEKKKVKSELAKKLESERVVIKDSSNWIQTLREDTKVLKTGESWRWVGQRKGENERWARARAGIGGVSKKACRKPW